MESFRKLRIYASTSDDAKYKILVNGSELVSYKPDDGELFSFETSTEFHGSVSVEIQVFEGFVTLSKCHATYPSIINTVPGTITMLQPMKEPIGILENGGIRSIPINGIVVSKGETFNYEHLLYNGPNVTIIELDGHDIQPNENLYLGDVLNHDVIAGIKGIEYKFEYSDVKPHNIWKGEDFEKLKEFILNNS